MVTSITNRLLPALLALASAFLTITLGLWLSGISVTTVFSALLSGAAGDTYRLAETAVKACPLLLTGLAVALALHAGVWNIGAEGQLLLGALAAAWIGSYATSLPPFLALPLVFITALTAGLVWAGGAAFLKQYRHVNEVISTIMLNFIAVNLVSYCVHGPLMETQGRYPQTDALPVAARLPLFFPPTRFHFGIPLALAMTTIVWAFLYRTKAGFRLRATGANSTAARFAGIRVDHEITRALLISGALAGLAGGIEVSGITHRVYEKFSPGYGYTAIAVALVGQRTPFGVFLAAVFFGALEAGSGALQRLAGVSSVLVSVIQAIVVLFLAAYSSDTVQQRLQRRREHL